MDVKPSSCWLLTGESGSGKTKFCQQLARAARKKGWSVSGILSKTVFEDGMKKGILARDLYTDESRPLARDAALSTRHEGLSDIPEAPRALALGRWLFDPRGIAWGNQVLASRTPLELLIVDELGPLEFLRGEGWVNALDALRSSFYGLAVVVVRPSLVHLAKEQLPITRVIEPSFPINDIFLSKLPDRFDQ